MDPDQARAFSFLHSVELPWPINYLPSIFRALAFIYILPILLLFIFDVGGYLLFKLLYKPFGDYPMYSYFKQAPPRECFSSSSSTSGSWAQFHGGNQNLSTSTIGKISQDASSSPDRSPILGIEESPTTKESNTGRLRERKTSTEGGLEKLEKEKDGLSRQLGFGADEDHNQVGFDGPMLDFKSPTASDYGEDSPSVDLDQVHQDDSSSEITSSN